MYCLKLTRLFILSLFILLCTKIKAEVFLVTSNADDGVGTIREAINKASLNGFTEKDFIHFNLADHSESGRTITLLSKLPNLSSNLEIDGSTQMGNFFGRSTAKIKLLTTFTYQESYFGLLIDNVSDVNIYGLYIKNGADFRGNLNVIYEYVQGISFRSSKNIKIGDIGKGNVICGFYRDLCSNARIGNELDTYVENMSFKANLIGLEADGKTIPPVLFQNQRASAYMANVYGIVDVGDGSMEGRNVFARGFLVNQINTGQYAGPLYTTPAFLNFRNNIFGNNLDFDVPGDFATAGLSIASSDPYTLSTVTITDNVVAGINAIIITGVKDPVIIKRNYIGVDKNLKKIPGIYSGIFLYFVNKAQVGGDDPKDANYIGYCKPIDIWPATSASINKNSFFCCVNSYPMILESYLTRTPPKIEITSASSSMIKGKATPNSQIELFYSDFCGTCSPETYFANTVADANGNWEYKGTLSRPVIASATLNGRTSEFTRTKIDVNGVKVINTCTNAGSIIGALPLSANDIEWLDEEGNVVGKEADLINVPIGKYRLKVSNGDCGEVSPYYEIKKGLIINFSNVHQTNPSCGIGGGISGIQIVNNTESALKYSWKNEIGNEISTSLDLINVVAGSYKLSVSTNDNSCIETFGPIRLISSTGPSIDISTLVVKPSSCNSNTGSITGIKATGNGTLSYKWKNANNMIIATTNDLLNQPAGTYVLEVNDQSSCAAVRSSSINILEANAISIKDDNIQIFNPTCFGNNGSVKGLEITGADGFVWRNSTGQIVSQKADLNGASPGRYQLTVSNPSCIKTYDVTLTEQSNLISYTGVTKTLTDASCGLNNGSIVVNLQNAIRLPKSYRWVDQFGVTVGGNTNTLSNVDAGKYTIYGIDDNGCEIELASYTIGRQPALVIDNTNYSIKNDYCNQHLASISGIKISGGLPPYKYKWIDANGKQVGNTLDINNLSEGNYVLQIIDAINCSPPVLNYIISNQNKDVPMPIVNTIKLCAPGIAIVNLNASNDALTYALYTTKESAFPKEITTNGTFKINVQNDVSYFITQRIGVCESEKAELKISVGLSGLTIAKAITPNNDGVNDYWSLKSIENYPDAIVQIFNRLGNKVYESKGYKTPFNGTYNGSMLPIGVYYYIIKLGSNCETLTGNLTIVY